MTARLSSLFLLAALLTFPASAKDKKKSSLPEYVLRATTVLVVVSPEAGEPLNEPRANATARDNVERALMQWGRLHPVMDGQESDLVIAVRTGSGGWCNRQSGADRLTSAREPRRPGMATSESAPNKVNRQR